MAEAARSPPEVTQVYAVVLLLSALLPKAPPSGTFTSCFLARISLLTLIPLPGSGPLVSLFILGLYPQLAGQALPRVVAGCEFSEP